MTNNEPAVTTAEATEVNEFEVVRKRLEEIAREVDDDGISLDDALDLYEEAVKLGLKASSLLEVGIAVEEEPEPETTAESESASAPDASIPDQDNA